MKNIIILFSISLSFLIAFGGCSANKPSSSLKKSQKDANTTTKDNKINRKTVIPTDQEFLDSLEASFNYFKNYEFSEEEENVDSFFVRVTDESKEWLQSMNEATQYEDSSDVVKRPFYEILTIAGVRLLYRNNVINQIDTVQILGVVTGKFGILSRVFSVDKLGPMWMNIKDGERYGYRGMASSDKVPLYYFKWSDEYYRWQLDLDSMLPIISRGLETVGLKQKWTPAKTVLYFLEAALDYEVNESLFKP